MCNITDKGDYLVSKDEVVDAYANYQYWVNFLYNHKRYGILCNMELAEYFCNFTSDLYFNLQDMYLEQNPNGLSDLVDTLLKVGNSFR